MTKARLGKNLTINSAGMRDRVEDLIVDTGKRRSWGSKGRNGTGVGWTNCGYIEGAFYILLYPALVRRMHVLSVLLVVSFWGQIQYEYLVQLAATIGNNNRYTPSFRCS